MGITLKSRALLCIKLILRVRECVKSKLFFDLNSLPDKTQNLDRFHLSHYWGRVICQVSIVKNKTFCTIQESIGIGKRNDIKARS